MIADLGINHVERHVLLAGHVLQPARRDYGIDLSMMTFDPEGEVERGDLSIQVKSTERVRVLADGKAVSVRIERRDLRAWLDDPLPFLLVLYDVSADCAYWVVVQKHLRRQRKEILRPGSKWVSLRLPKVNVLDCAVIHDVVAQKRSLMPRLLTVSYEDE